MPELPVEISYHRQKSSTARIRKGRIHLRISNLVSRREQQRHIEELLGKMKDKYSDEGFHEEPVTLQPWIEGLVSSQESVGTDRESRIEGQELSEGECEKMKNGQWSMNNDEEAPVVLRLSTGVEYELVLKKAQHPNLKIQKIGQKLVILWPIVRKMIDFEEIERKLWKFLIKDQVFAVEKRLNELREGWIEETFEQVKLKQVVSRWGSCDKHRGIVMLSVKLLILEAKLFDYVCIHELAHLRYADHSDLFWDLVAQKMPDWKVQRKRLRGYE